MQGMFYIFQCGDGQGVAIDSNQTPPILYATGYNLYFFKAALSQQPPASRTLFGVGYHFPQIAFP